MKAYKLTFFRYIRTKIVQLLIAYLFSFILGMSTEIDMLISGLFLFLFILGITLPWEVNYILNDWGKELRIDKAKKKLVLTKGKEKLHLIFSEIDCVRKFYSEEFLSRWNGGCYYRIRLKEPNDSVIFISRMTIDDLDKELEGVPIYNTIEFFALIPNWKRPSKRPLIEKDPPARADVSSVCCKQIKR